MPIAVAGVLRGFGAGSFFWQWLLRFLGVSQFGCRLGRLTTRTTRIAALRDDLRDQKLSIIGTKPSQIALMWEPRGSITNMSPAKSDCCWKSHGLYRA